MFHRGSGLPAFISVCVCVCGTERGEYSRQGQQQHIYRSTLGICGGKISDLRRSRVSLSHRKFLRPSPPLLFLYNSWQQTSSASPAHRKERFSKARLMAVKGCRNDDWMGLKFDFICRGNQWFLSPSSFVDASIGSRWARRKKITLFFFFENMHNVFPAEWQCINIAELYSFSRKEKVLVYQTALVYLYIRHH